MRGIEPECEIGLTLLQTRLHIFQKIKKKQISPSARLTSKENEKLPRNPGLALPPESKAKPRSFAADTKSERDFQKFQRGFNVASQGASTRLRKKNEKLPRNPGPTLPPDSKAKSRSFVSKSNGLSTRYSQPVTHASTNRARRCLTSQIGRDGVYSTWYGPSREMHVLKALLKRAATATRCGFSSFLSFFLSLPHPPPAHPHHPCIGMCV